MNYEFDFKAEQDLQNELINLSHENIKIIKEYILTSIYWTDTNDLNLHRLSHNLLISVTYRSPTILLYSELIFDLINSDDKIGAKFRFFLINSLNHSISQEIIYPNRISHFTLLYFLYKKDIIDLKYIINLFPESIENTLAEKDMIIFSFFSNYIKIERKSLYDNIKFFFDNFKESTPIYLRDFAKCFSNDNFSIDAHIYQLNSLKNCLKNDDIETLKKMTSNPEFDYNQTIAPSIYEPSFLLQNYPPLLHFTAFYQSIKCFNFLIMVGADTNLTDQLKRPLSLFAVAGGCIEIIRIIEQKQLSFEGALQIASLFHRNEILCWLHETLFQKVSLSQYSNGKKTVLNQASISNNLFAVDFCLKKKVKINQQNARKSTALHLAAAYNNFDVIQTILGRNHSKLDPNIINIAGMTPLMTAVQRQNIEAVGTFLDYYNKNISNSNIIKIDLEKKSDNNEKDFTIHIAAKTGNADIFGLILRSTKNVNVKQKYGYTAMHIAVSMHHTKVVQELIRDERVDVNAKDSAGWTPLHLAAQFGFEDVVKLLVKLAPRIDLNAKTHDGKTALDLAVNEDRTSIIELIK